MVEVLKKVSKGLGVLVCTLMVGLAVSFVLPTNGVTNNNTSVAQAGAKVKTKNITMSKGASGQIKITGTKKKVTYSTSNKKIVTVSKKGVVKAKRKGSATIKAKVAGKTFKIKVKVEDPRISKTGVKIERGKSYQLKVTGTSRKVSWSSSNRSVATVDGKGKVQAKSNGQAVITATINDKRFACKILVYGKNVIVCPDTITLKYGETKKVILTGGDGFTYAPENGSLLDVSITPQRFYAGQKLTMTLTGKAVGTTYIVFKSNAGWTKKCKVVVTGDKIATGVVQSVMNNVKVNWINAYKSCNTKSPEVYLESSVTSNVNAKSVSVYYALYNKNGELIGIDEDVITNVVKGKEYVRRFRLKDASNVKVNDIATIHIALIETN